MAPPQKKARTGRPKSWLAILNAPAFEDIPPPPSRKHESDSSKKKTGPCGPGVRRLRFDEQAPRVIMYTSLDRASRRALWYSVSSWTTACSCILFCSTDQCFQFSSSRPCTQTSSLHRLTIGLACPHLTTTTTTNNNQFRAPNWNK